MCTRVECVSFIFKFPKVIRSNFSLSKSLIYAIYIYFSNNKSNNNKNSYLLISCWHFSHFSFSYEVKELWWEAVNMNIINNTFLSVGKCTEDFKGMKVE